MRVISKGSETTKRLTLLLTQSGIKSENTIGALHDHLVKGHSVSASAALNSVSTSNLERDIAKINNIAEFVVKMQDHDWERFKADEKSVGEEHY